MCIAKSKINAVKSFPLNKRIKGIFTETFYKIKMIDNANDSLSQSLEINHLYEFEH